MSDPFVGVKAILDSTAQDFANDMQQRWNTISLLKRSLKQIAALKPDEDDHSLRLAVSIAKQALSETDDWPHA